MTRLLQRGSLTNRFADDSRSLDTFQDGLDGDEEEDKHERVSLLILLVDFLRKAFNSHNFHNKSGDMGFRCIGMPEISSIRNLLNGTCRYAGMFAQAPDASPLSSPPNQSNSILGHPASVQNKRALSSSLAKIIMLIFISIFILIAMLGSNNSNYTSIPVSNHLSSSYRKLQEQFSLDLMNGGIFGLGAIHLRKLDVCRKDMENYVPCYNASTVAETRLSEIERHCGTPGNGTLCLIRPPKNYTLPLQWPHCINNIWMQNTKGERKLKEFKIERVTVGNDNLLRFEDEKIGGAEEHFRKVANILGISSDKSLQRFGVQTVLDIGCSYGAFVHFLSKEAMALCVAPFETQGGHVQITLERGLPAMIGSLVAKQLPFPPSSFDMIHCAGCGIDWSKKDGTLLLEIDRLLRVNGYFVWTKPAVRRGNTIAELASERSLRTINDAAKAMCWNPFAPQDQVFAWRKSADSLCSSESNKNWSICDDTRKSKAALYESIRPCRHSTKEEEHRTLLQQLDFSTSGFSLEELLNEPTAWASTIKSYWSVMTPLIFSDHPKRPAEDDPLPPSNMFRNVMDMNALYGGFNSALLQAGKSVWVMNVVPSSDWNTLSIIYEHGLIGVLHDWCEAFPTYPRTYDLLHGIGVLSQQVEKGCRLSDLLLEMDRILRPEGWVLLRDTMELIEEARIAASQMRWEARTIEVEGENRLRLLVCQKAFWKN